VVLILLIAAGLGALGTARAGARPAAARPKLVCLIVIDQFRQDYLTRFASSFGPDGFNRLLRHGASFTDAHYRHAATYTGPGHALIISGSYPHRTSIVSNDWYNRTTGRREAILYDPAAQLIGLDAALADDTSPRHFIGSTLGDQLKLATGGRAKVVAVSMKDRAAILMGGRLGKAYWFHERAGRFISSSYYGTDLPAWAQRFNTQDTPDRFFGQTWDRLLSATAYETAAPDDAPWKQDLAGLGRTFPHRLTGGLTKPGPEFYTAFDATPWATQYELEFARAAVEGENLGTGSTPDLLAISLSANDYAGHAFGPYSQEVQDLAVRTDRMLAEFFQYLSRRFGPDGVLLALTADHGVTPIPEYAVSIGLDAGRISDAAVRGAITKALSERYGDGDWISGLADPSIFLNRALLAEKKLDPEAAARAAADACMMIPGVAACFTRGQLLHGPLPPTELAATAERSFHPERSGDLLLLPKPFYFWSNKYGSLTYGTTHGTPYNYDTHVPLLLAGPGIHPGEYARFVDMADLAPTLASLLAIEAPAGSEGHVIPEITSSGQP
jgi:predicted AlkP superfamily pyrophosphatase or phosphodiesterase